MILDEAVADDLIVSRAKLPAAFLRISDPPELGVLLLSRASSSRSDSDNAPGSRALPGLPLGLHQLLNVQSSIPSDRATSASGLRLRDS